MDGGVAGPHNKEELFNLKHSSAWNAIDRTFGLLKVRWAILRSHSFYPIKVQKRIIMACCFLHNVIRKEMPEDSLKLELSRLANQPPMRMLNLCQLLTTILLGTVEEMNLRIPCTLNGCRVYEE
ncbi:UNVERIFIED_CONTAM: hypothetical protein Sangu_2418200 [Sesamum angustifolium]|uniref:DDE Tnp4 domain-containing protein n=1 Tax=Sesamum angustifolium TaxID=2727405 RepID=A0AAW2KW28_9LAMI